MWDLFFIFELIGGRGEAYNPLTLLLALEARLSGSSLPSRSLMTLSVRSWGTRSMSPPGALPLVSFDDSPMSWVALLPLFSVALLTVWLSFSLWDNGTSSLGFERSSLGFERSSLSFERSSLGCERSSLGFERSSLDFERSSLGFERSSLGFKRSSLDFERLSLSFELSSSRVCSLIFLLAGSGDGSLPLSF